jgi:hypothetical protein
MELVSAAIRPCKSEGAIVDAREKFREIGKVAGRRDARRLFSLWMAPSTASMPAKKMTGRCLSKRIGQMTRAATPVSSSTVMRVTLLLELGSCRRGQPLDPLPSSP